MMIMKIKIPLFKNKKKIETEVTNVQDNYTSSSPKLIEVNQIASEKILRLFMIAIYYELPEDIAAKVFARFKKELINEWEQKYGYD